jgi:hypothetical protein
MIYGLNQPILLNNCFPAVRNALSELRVMIIEIVVGILDLEVASLKTPVLETQITHPPTAPLSPRAMTLRIVLDDRENTDVQDLILQDVD